jgi:hypothetical protein
MALVEEHRDRNESFALLWTRSHQLASAVMSLVGAVAAVLFGFIHSPAFYGPETWGAFMAWLSFPESYWRWPLVGFLGTGLAFYAAQLIRRSN